MNFTAAMLLVAQASGVSATVPAIGIAEPATATVRILRPVVVDFAAAEITLPADAPAPQRNRDGAGRTWIEFS